MMGHETNSAIQEHKVDFGQPLRNVCPNIQGGADFSFISASRILKMKSSTNLLPISVMKL